MSAPCSQPWTGPVSRRSSRHINPDLRVSDSERSDVADRLSRHYADGRLDQAEFNERLERAMAAKTHSDLGGLFTDLPTADGPELVAPRRAGRRHSHNHYLLFVLLAVAIASSIGHTWVHFPLFHLSPGWLVVGLIAVLWLRRDRRHRHY